MKVSSAFIADAVSMREGLLSALSAGITHFNVAGFPASVNVGFGALIDVLPGEHPLESTDWNFSLTFSAEASEEILAEVEGQITGRAEDTENHTKIPVAVPLTTLPVLEEGLHWFEFKFSDLSPVRVPVLVRLVTH